MAEYQISPEKLRAMRIEHAVNNWGADMKNDSDLERGLRLIFVRYTTLDPKNEVLQKRLKIEGMEEVLNQLDSSPEAEELRRKHSLSRQVFLEELREANNSDETQSFNPIWWID